MKGRAIQPAEVEQAVPDGEGLIAKQGIPDLLQAEYEAALQSIESGLYVSFLPNPSATIPASAANEIKAGTAQCCRVGQSSPCRCGHALSEHKSVKLPKRPAFIIPPSCERCKCRSYCYSPLFPEECGQWWLRRRRDFNILDWRKVIQTMPRAGADFPAFVSGLSNVRCAVFFILQRVRQLPDEYACVGCNLKLSDHECLFESRADRVARGAATDQAYIPLSTPSSHK